MSDYIRYIKNPQRDCAIVAHRGAWHQAPENSLLSLKNAIEAGYQIVEIDVRQSVDGELFLFHDETLERMAGRAEDPETLTIEQLRIVHLRNRNGGVHNPLTDQKIPTLFEVLSVAKDCIFIDLDVKNRDLIPLVAEYVKTNGMAGQVNIKARVNNGAQAKALQQKGVLTGVPFMPKSYFSKDTADEVLDVLSSLSPFMTEASFDELTTLSERQSVFAAQGISLWVNTLNDGAYCGLDDSTALHSPDLVWGKLLDAGVSVIQTDEPEALQTYLRARSYADV
ncbi:glycerophosphodiester phosphodiesterase family protein [Buttiauxella sp. A2-C2_NF]|uniref:glycerophosphodiester phosphodiesterase family protein n=2 Tax=Buttiauxella ferragutiae TaxID=82989 RepID=UPI001E3F7BDB|nr:glycerophosphodiester phosphodiesterase family protein [Buttiauxella ferragutiae]MCE0828828.1 glycerophosphodiester phosphodiesterase family protein [Buttiauxella ferragutiae]